MSDSSKAYRDTLNLPATRFPMKADLAQQEPAQLARWEAAGLYRTIRDRGGDERFILHDGPPYANGHIHIGHALNKILKDIIIKFQTMTGHDAPYVPGWDCHGLPIEHQVLKDLGPKKQGMSKIEIRKRCREYAEKFVAIQREEFKRLGVLGDWDHPYLTMTPAYEAAIVREFGKIVETGAVYKGKKPVLWCPFDETALAEAEVEYADHTSPSIYVKFPLRGAGQEKLQDIFQSFRNDVPAGAQQIMANRLSVVVWTTTPWTLVANRAICLHPEFEYAVLIAGNEAYIVARDRIGDFQKTAGLTETYQNLSVVYTFKGARLQGWEFSHPWLDQPSPIVLGEHVTLDQGTGCVHTAPGHGQEDYQVGLQYNLEVYAPVDHQGRFTDDAGPFAHQKVFEANQAIIDLLKNRGRLLAESTISHSYPHCWRCKKPVIFRATEQWFISMEATDLRRKAIEEIDKVAWVPKWGRERIYGMMANRPDWCISRQRVWGVPIVAFTCLDCHNPLFSKTIADHVADSMEREGGSDIWFSRSADDLLPAGTACATCGGHRFQQEGDILDVWFESGVSHAAVLKARPELAWPADLYLEGSDQHRGWFHSALLTSLLTDGHAPYRSVLTHGFVVDGEGKKMSKSAGNVIAPQEVIKQHGAEILRLWVAAEDYRDDIRISPAIMSQLIEAYRKIRNTCRFLLANLGDFDPRHDAANPSALHEIDRWALHRLQGLIERIRDAYGAYEFHAVFHALNNFCAVDLSAVYLDVLKDRLYTAGRTSSDRRAAQYVLDQTLSTLVRLMAPILSFTAEELWSHLPETSRTAPSVHLARFPSLEPGWRLSNERAAAWERLFQIRTEVTRALERARADKTIGSSLEARVTLYASEELGAFLREHAPQLAAVFIVSGVNLAPFEHRPHDVAPLTADLAVAVARAEGAKCARCWTYRLDVGRDGRHPELCARCVTVLDQG
ncbi:MAG: isoleucine--tRNA ligase [Nitrospirae bacterium]|nr:isoleucine--tRNA ligase [Nitrospirota bacterium]